METIFTRQNEDKNIDRLCAQKQIYIDAKKVFMLQIILTVPVTILLSVTKIIMSFWNIDISAYVLVYGIALTIIDLLLINFVINEDKKNAAKIQESFDCSVYDLEWNKVYVGKKPTQETINKYSRAFKKSGKPLSKLIDWYPIELKEQPPFKAIALCQKTNLNYDTAIRNSFKNKVLMVSIITLILLIIFGLIKNISLKDFIGEVAASFLPVIVLTIKIFIDQNKTIKTSKELKECIDELLEDETNISLKEIRSIQDKIYNSRKESALIPEYFYDKIRDRLESEMHFNASNY